MTSFPSSIGMRPHHFHKYCPPSNGNPVLRLLRTDVYETSKKAVPSVSWGWLYAPALLIFPAVNQKTWQAFHRIRSIQAAPPVSAPECSAVEKVRNKFGG